MLHLLDQRCDGLEEARGYLVEHKLCYNVVCLVASVHTDGHIAGGIAAAEKFLSVAVEDANSTHSETEWVEWSTKGTTPHFKKARRLHARLLQLRIGSAERGLFIKCTNLNLNLKYHHKAPIATSCTTSAVYTFY